MSFKPIVKNDEPGSRFFFARSVYHTTYSLFEKYKYYKIIATLLNKPTIEFRQTYILSRALAIKDGAVRVFHNFLNSK